MQPFNSAGDHVETYRLYYTKSGTTYRLAIVGERSGKIAGSKSPSRPKVAQVRTWLASKGFEAYGDMRQLSDGSFVSMLRKI